MNPPIRLSYRWEIGLITDSAFGKEGDVVILTYETQFFSPQWRECGKIPTTQLFDRLTELMGYPMPDNQRRAVIAELRKQWRDHLKDIAKWHKQISSLT